MLGQSWQCIRSSPHDYHHRRDDLLFVHRRDAGRSLDGPKYTLAPKALKLRVALLIMMMMMMTLVVGVTAHVTVLLWIVLLLGCSPVRLMPIMMIVVLSGCVVRALSALCCVVGVDADAASCLYTFVYTNCARVCAALIFAECVSSRVYIIRAQYVCVRICMLAQSMLVCFIVRFYARVEKYIQCCSACAKSRVFCGIGEEDMKFDVISYICWNICQPGAGLSCICDPAWKFAIGHFGRVDCGSCGCGDNVASISYTYIEITSYLAWRLRITHYSLTHVM